MIFVKDGAREFCAVIKLHDCDQKALYEKL